MFKIEQTAKAASRDDTADSRRTPHDRGKPMHGGMNVHEPYSQFRKQAEDYVKLAGQETNTENQRIWIALARECLRLAAGAKSMSEGRAASVGGLPI